MFQEDGIEPETTKPFTAAFSAARLQASPSHLARSLTARSVGAPAQAIPAENDPLKLDGCSSSVRQGEGNPVRTGRPVADADTIVPQQQHCKPIRQSPMRIAGANQEEPEPDLCGAQQQSFHGMAQVTAYLGLENYGNTCYCNAVLQLLLNCNLIRQRLRHIYGAFYHPTNPTRRNPDESILGKFSELCYLLDNSRTEGFSGPRQFVTKMKEGRPAFDNSMQQDAHEFLTYIVESIFDTEKKLLELGPRGEGPLQKMFEGGMVSEITCGGCEKVSPSQEGIVVLSIEIGQSHTLEKCFQTFSHSEVIDSYECSSCKPRPVAKKALKLFLAPPLLLVHLKRFRFVPSRNVYEKLAHRITFPDQLSLPFHHPDRLVHYRLCGFVVHHGANLDSGHYFACCRTGVNDSVWRKFDDEVVTIIQESDIEGYFGSSVALDEPSATSTAYILLYARLEDC